VNAYPQDLAIGPGVAVKRRPAPTVIGVAPLIAAAFAIAASTHLLLWRFLDWATLPVYAGGAVMATALVWLAARSSAALPAGIPAARLLWCLAIAVALLILGGEGRLLYLNHDWQVRDAVLGDMVRNDWPFAYTARGTAELLRAPLGMYLWPALAGKAGGDIAADILLLVQNAVLLGVVLALGSTLFPARAQRWLAAAAIILFSGMDLAGAYLFPWLDLTPSPAASSLLAFDHIENWHHGLQFTSHLAQAAWVPQHALAGWIGAVLFLLWRAGHVRVGALLASVPLMALWSPLSAAGIIPFAAFAGLSDLVGRRLRASDWALPALCTALAVPALLYLTAAGDSVGIRFDWVGQHRYAAFLTIEVGLILLLAMALIGAGRFGSGTLRLVGIMLAITPLFRIGEGLDFTMRVSIPALAVLAVLAADALHAGWRQRGDRRSAMLGCGLGLVMVVGAITPLLEVARAFAYQPSPRTKCSLIGSWDGFEWEDRLVTDPTTKSTYLAPIASLPAFMAPDRPVRVPHEQDPARCWSRRWKTPR
jgi:hypothetical protein